MQKQEDPVPLEIISPAGGRDSVTGLKSAVRARRAENADERPRGMKVREGPVTGDGTEHARSRLESGERKQTAL